MALAIVRSGLRTALRGGQRGTLSKRTFSSSGHQNDAYETAKWEKITYAGIVACSILAFVNLSKGHPFLNRPLHTHTCTFVTRSFHGVLMAFLRLSIIDPRRSTN